MEKRTLNRIIVGWILLLIIVALFGKVTVAATEGGQTAADFLHIGLGARAAGMGGAFTAVSEGAQSAYWNPASLASGSSTEIALGHFAWFQDITVEQGAFAHNFGERSSLAGSIGFLNYGTIDGRDGSGVATGDISVYDWYGAVSYAFAVTPQLSLGATGKYINQKLDDLSASTFAADIGVRYQFEHVTLAVVGANLGPDMDFEGVKEHLPSSVRVGVAADFMDRRLLAAVEVDRRIHGGTVLRNGLEYGFRNQYFVRAGYNFYPGQDDRSFGAGPSFGVGLRLEQFDLDYAYTLQDSYASDDLHRFSVVLKLGN